MDKKISLDLFSPQLYYINEVRQTAANIYGAPKACVNTFGCQQNVSDSEHYKGMLEKMGYEVGNASFPMKRYTEEEKKAMIAKYKEAGLEI